MSKRVLFNGAVLVRPGASTKIDASQFANINLSGIGTVAIIGDADGGQPRTVQVFTTPGAVKSFYKSGDLVEAAAIVADPGNDPRIPGGAQQIVCYKTNLSTQATYLHPASPNQVHTFLSRQYGFATNNITVTIATDGGNGRSVTITDLDDFGAVITEQSPVLGLVGKFSMQYTGAGTPATLTITSTQLTTAVTGGTAGDALTLNFSDFPNLAALIAYIDNHPNYTATALIANAADFDPTNLDAVAAVNVLVAATVYARNFDLADWVNNNSAIVSDTLTVGKTGPVTALTKTPLAGGARGTSDNSAWTAGFLALRGTRVNQIVPLASKDAVASVGTYTIDSLVAATVAHAKFVSSTIGRNEGQAFVGIEKTKANLILAATTANSEHLCLVGQKPKRPRTFDGKIVSMAEWAYACILAGMRAGAPLGEPLTWKYVNVQGHTSDSSWTETSTDDVTDLTLNGVVVINEVKGRGYRIDKCITTFTKFDNDAYTEETIVQIWKNVAYELRKALEDTYVGRPGTLTTVQTVPAIVSRVCDQFRRQGAITDSIINGATVPAYREINYDLDGDKLSVSLVISPTPGINFVLNTIVLVPARIQAAA